jgi:creatinine amidohydrolase
MHFEAMNWQMVEDYLKRDDRIMLVLGMTEQHSSLSLLTDSLIPHHLAAAASKETGILVAPPLHYGVSPSMMAYPGTISLRLATYLQIIEDITLSLYSHGFRRFLFLNGHGGNAPARTQLAELANRHPGLDLRWYQWWTSEAVVSFSRAHGLPNAHANWEENFPFTRIEPCHPGQKNLVPYDERVRSAAETRALAQDGSFGGPWQADDATMDALFAVCLADILRLLAFE